MIEGLKEVEIENSQVHDGVVFPIGLAPTEKISLDQALQIIKDNKDKLHGN